MHIKISLSFSQLFFFLPSSNSRNLKFLLMHFIYEKNMRNYAIFIIYRRGQLPFVHMQSNSKWSCRIFFCYYCIFRVWHHSIWWMVIIILCDITINKKKKNTRMDIEIKYERKKWTMEKRIQIQVETMPLRVFFYE